MPLVTFQVLEGVDKGRIFRNLATPITIGREEGNLLRLNDERISRFHAKVQFDNNEIILTDLESTNGTRVNGLNVQIRRLRIGDRVGIGRSLLLFGSEQEIAARIASLTSLGSPSTKKVDPSGGMPFPQLANTLAAEFDNEFDFDLNLNQPVTVAKGNIYLGDRPLPPLPQKMSPSQAARLAEILDFLHRHLTLGTENIHANEDASQVVLSFPDWQRVLGVQMLLARYVRAVAEPDILDE
jgi:pSer/pThr/pTyr-binding forkhead associated (FHA) protein